MTNSIVQPDSKQCFFCSKQYSLEKHHIYAGTANRKLSDKYGLWVWLCHDCHTGTEGAQYDKEKNLRLKKAGQKAFEKSHTRNEFRKIFGKSYLDEPYMEYKCKIEIDKAEKEFIESILHTEPTSESECFKEEEMITYTHKLKDGKEIVVQVCGVQYEPNSLCNTPWTQVILFDENGYEIACSEPCEEFFGEWELEHDDIIYKITIV